MPNAYMRLRERCLKTATRPFNARGKSVVRCERCFLKVAKCICAARPSVVAQTDWLLLMHRDEVFKPTNTGRLIADVLPENTLAFEWSRTQPCAELLSVLNDPKRFCAIAYPATDEALQTVLHSVPTSLSGRRFTVILLDATWRQAGRMYRMSSYLQSIPLLNLPKGASPLAAQYAVRQASQEGLLSTAEAAAQLMAACNESQAAQALTTYFALFNKNYVAMRGR